LDATMFDNIFCGGGEEAKEREQRRMLEAVRMGVEEAIWYL
jgi:hypothetical protein